MEIWDAVLQAVQSTGANNILTTFGVYIAVPLAVHIQIQFIKYDRREKRHPKIGNWSIRGVAFVMCTGLALFVGWRLGGWGFDKSLNHAVNIGVFYPVAMWVLMSYLKKKFPDAYRKLSAPRRRRTKVPEDADSTWDGFE